MAAISGIQFEKNAKGDNTYVRINLKKYGEKLEPFLHKIGISTISKTEDDFEKEWKNGLTGKELLNKVKNHIEKLPWENYNSN